jgi:hypothetical protein
MQEIREIEALSPKEGKCYRAGADGQATMGGIIADYKPEDENPAKQLRL